MNGRKIWPAWVTTALVVVFAAGCATTAEMEGTDAPAGVSSIVVQNDLLERRDVIVYLEPEGRGERMQLGRVPAGATVTLPAEVERGSYVLIAAHEVGDMRSSRFNIIGASTVRWQLAVDRVLVTRR